jgi:hypothetical protein
MVIYPLKIVIYPKNCDLAWEFMLVEWDFSWDLPSGKHTTKLWTITMLFMGKSTISKWAMASIAT